MALLEVVFDCEHLNSLKEQSHQRQTQNYVEKISKVFPKRRVNKLIYCFIHSALAVFELEEKDNRASYQTAKVDISLHNNLKRGKFDI